jgi:hypothetical protein
MSRDESLERIGTEAPATRTREAGIFWIRAVLR